MRGGLTPGEEDQDPLRPLLTLQLCCACSRLAVNWRHRHGTAASRAQDTNLGEQGVSGVPKTPEKGSQGLRGVPSALPVPSQFPDWPLPRFRVRVGVVHDHGAAPSQGGRAGRDTALPRAQRVLGVTSGGTGVTTCQGGSTGRDTAWL